MENKKIFLFGASSYGKKVYEELKSLYNICGFLDNDSKKWGNKFIDDKIIISPNEIKNMDNYYILITSTYAGEIFTQLKQMNITNFGAYPNLEFCTKGDYSNKELGKKIDLAAYRLFFKLKDVKIDKLNISEYNMCYLASKDLNELFTYSCILYTILSNNPKSNTFLDYGGGSGVLSLLALEYGIPNVFYNDIYDVSCKDAEIIATKLSYKRQGYIEGDIDQVIKYTQKENILFDAIGSYDVIEHIFDLKSFYKDLRNILSNNSIVCMESSANSFNEKFIESAGLGHLKVDFLNRPKVFGHKERDNLKAYCKIRMDIIRKYSESSNNTLKEIEIIALAFLTRGLMSDGIIKAVDNYINNEELPKPNMFFEYNTCDPITGNWAEHIIDFEELNTYLQTIGFQTFFTFRGDKKTSITIQINSKYIK